MTIFGSRITWKPLLLYSQRMLMLLQSILVSGHSTLVDAYFLREVRVWWHPRICMMLWLKAGFPACCLTVQKAVLDEIGGLDETLRGNDDWELLLRLSRRRRVVGLARPLALHREHSGGLSSNYEHMLQDNLLAVAKHFGGEEGVPTEWPGRAQASLCRRVLPVLSRPPSPRRYRAGLSAVQQVGDDLSPDCGACEHLVRYCLQLPAEGLARPRC